MTTSTISEYDITLADLISEHVPDLDTDEIDLDTLDFAVLDYDVLDIERASGNADPNLTARDVVDSLLDHGDVERGVRGDIDRWVDADAPRGDAEAWLLDYALEALRKTAYDTATNILAAR